MLEKLLALKGWQIEYHNGKIWLFEEDVFGRRMYGDETGEPIKVGTSEEAIEFLKKRANTPIPFYSNDLSFPRIDIAKLHQDIIKGIGSTEIMLTNRDDLINGVWADCHIRINSEEIHISLDANTQIEKYRKTWVATCPDPEVGNALIHYELTEPESVDADMLVDTLVNIFEMRRQMKTPNHGAQF